MQKITINGKYKIVLPEHRAKAWEHEWEAQRIKRLHDVIKERKKQNANEFCKVYYIGAEEGDIPALCQMWGASLLLVEASDRSLPNIKAIWQANGLSNPDILIGFMGNDATVKVDWNHRIDLDKVSGEIVTDFGFKELHNTTDVPVYRIDDLISAGFVSPDIITMDVEGSEFEVLKGAENVITTFKPDIILSLHPEFLFNYWGVYSRNLRDWIIDRGYTEELLDYQHEVHLHYKPI